MKTGKYLLALNECDKTKVEIIGSKAANLGELSRMGDINVPDGFCISTRAFEQIINQRAIKSLIHQLCDLQVEDRHFINKLSREIRHNIENIPIPQELIDEIESFLSRYDKNQAFAVRSSATAEDLPTASFAGQQDSYLNIIGLDSILVHCSNCWASLFTERAIVYRIQNGFDHSKVYLAVIVQKMVLPRVAGIMFTADPVNSNRKVLSIDASYGLGEAMVSGRVDPDNYRVQNGRIIKKIISSKKTAVYAMQHGGTIEDVISPARQTVQALTDNEILHLERIGRKIENHFGHPQDIEWCLADDDFYIVQSRPITTLYPIPATDDHDNHVYISVGHLQMMIDPIKPLGLSIWQLTALRPMFIAGGRLFVDVTHQLADPAIRELLLNGFAQSDPLIKDALVTLLDRGDFIKSLPDDGKNSNATATKTLPFPSKNENDIDPAVAADLVRNDERLIEQLKLEIQSKKGSELFDFIEENIRQLKKTLSKPESLNVIMTALAAYSWINENMFLWLGEKGAGDKISQSVPNNVTSEMGLALLDVADAIRPYPEIVHYLKNVKDENFLDTLPHFEGGMKAREALQEFLDKYGMRCVGEIDITKTRWSEKPLTIIPLLLSNIQNFEAGASAKKYKEGRQQAIDKEQELLQRLRNLPGGDQKATETKRRIETVRNLIGYREFPKYVMVNHFFIYKQALLKEAAQLKDTGILQSKEDAFYLTLAEFQQAVRTNEIDYALINQRKQQYKQFEKLTPPRVITSDGEIITGSYRREHLPENAIIGLAVSSGIVEGRARVISKIEDASLKEGDILVTTATDPSWTPLFVSVKGLVTEVGGLMTHGAVIAREYGLPAVVGVENVTKLIKDGQQIRVNGTEGYIELL